MPKLEVKVLVPPEAWDTLADAADLGRPGRVGKAWFYDTPDLATFRQGVILRARVQEDDADTTVKLRGADVEGLDLDAFSDLDGYKLEEDCTAKGCTPAASLTVDEPKRRPPDRFTMEQLALAAAGGAQVPWSQLVRYGPVATERWKVDASGIVVERWRIGDHTLIEVSRRSGKRPWVALGKLTELLRSWQVDAEGQAGGKTAWALGLLVTPPR